MSGNLLVRFDEGRVGRTAGVALSPTLLSICGVFFHFTAPERRSPLKPLSTRQRLTRGGPSTYDVVCRARLPGMPRRTK